MLHVTVTDMESSATRGYRMVARAESASETGDRILDAATEAFWERPSDQISLEAVADRAGVSVRTVIRRFGGKEGLFAASAARELRRTRDERDQAPVGDVPAAVAVLVEHYEQMGDRVLKLLAEESRVPTLSRGRRPRARPAPGVVRTGFRSGPVRPRRRSTAVGGWPSWSPSVTCTCGSCCGVTHGSVETRWSWHSSSCSPR